MHDMAKARFLFPLNTLECRQALAWTFRDRDRQRQWDRTETPEVLDTHQRSCEGEGALTSTASQQLRVLLRPHRFATLEHTVPLLNMDHGFKTSETRSDTA